MRWLTATSGLPKSVHSKVQRLVELLDEVDGPLDQLGGCCQHAAANNSAGENTEPDLDLIKPSWQGVAV